MPEPKPVVSVPPYVHRRSEVSSPIEPPDPRESQWLPIVKQQRRQMQREAPGPHHRITQAELDADYDFYSPPCTTQPLPRPTIRERWTRRSMYNPYGLLLTRAIVFVCSLIALILAVHIFRLESPVKNTSAKMAIIVEPIAIAFIIYVGYDEFTGQSIGLRPAYDKARLIFLDLFFLIFGTANLTLAFSTANDLRSPDLPRTAWPLAVKTYGLAAALLIHLMAWVLAFLISASRLIWQLDTRGKMSLKGQAELVRCAKRDAIREYKHHEALAAARRGKQKEVRRSIEEDGPDEEMIPLRQDQEEASVAGT
ncbi:MAG: hypothetical protein Q9213_001489 [Squamulea squamosa]